MPDTFDVSDLVARLEEVERRLDAHDANLDRIERAVRALAWKEGRTPETLATLRQLGDFPSAPEEPRP